MASLHELARLGQSVWLDNMQRCLLTSGDLARLVEKGVSGLTSNPSIFEKAIAGCPDYDGEIRRYAAKGLTAPAILEQLMLADLQGAADVLRPVFDRSGGTDGFISLEPDPHLANDTATTIFEVRRLFKALNRPNVMIKVPGTAEGIPAIARLLSEGINVNVTLMFSLADYDAVSEAYLMGLEQRVAAGGDISPLASVASFFVSRVDGVVDALLEKQGNTALQGKTAIANAKLAYSRFMLKFSGPRWRALAAKGAHVQRPLWASTSTKNPAYPDTLYVDTLIGPHTVNTLPPATLDAFMDHGTVAPTLEQGVDEAREHLRALAKTGIKLDDVTARLQVDGVAAFIKSYDSLLKTLEQKLAEMKAQ